jgi:hypothetical protein
MSVSPVGSNIVHAAVQSQPRAETGEVPGAPDHDGDADDVAMAQTPPAPVAKPPTQTVGTVVNTKA